LGGLNLYATQHDTINPEVVWMAELLATQAARALGHVREAENLAWQMKPSLNIHRWSATPDSRVDPRVSG
jgi:hypothetical protein